MNRQIKFRGKRVDNGEWVFGFPIMAKYDDVEAAGIVIQEHNPTTGFKAHAIHNVIPETVGQFTGLPDKNGKEIYEGDFIKLDEEYKGHGQNPTYVIFHDSKWMTQGTQYFGHKFDLTSFSLDRMSVIGSIHDNPELLKQ